MSLRKRGKIWWVDIVAPSGERIRQTTGTETKALAQEFHDRLKNDLWRIGKLGERPRRIWDDAVVRWLSEQSHKATIDTDKSHLRWLDSHLRGIPLDKISREVIDLITRSKIEEGVTNATVNRILEVMRAILTKCTNDWEWLDRTPKFRMLSEPKRRIRFITRIEAESLLAELPPHLAEMASFTLATGLWRANVTGLQWTQVDVEKRLAWIHPDQAKARKAIPVPLNNEAVTIVQRQSGKHSTHIFTFRGKPIRQVSTKAWYLALARASITDFRWHDLRHTWASWHVQQGTPLYALQELGGWESPEMVRRYAHFSADHLAVYADKLCATEISPPQNNDTNMAHEEK